MEGAAGAYADYRTFDPQEWASREAEGILLLPHAIEVVYRTESPSHVRGRLIGFTLLLAGAFTVVDAAIWMLTWEGAFQFLIR